MYNIFRPFQPRFIACLALAGLITASSARGGYLTNYEVEIYPNTFTQVNRIVIAEKAMAWGSLTWAFAVSEGNTLITNPFELAALPDRALLLGLAESVNRETSEVFKHLVLFLSNEAAELAEGVEWEVLFETPEAELIADLELMTSGLPFEEIDSGLQGVITFIDNLYDEGIVREGYEPRPAFFQFGDTFTVVAFSTGQIIGTGRSFGTFVIPEPGSIALVGTGLMGVILAALGRRRLRGEPEKGFRLRLRG